MVCRPADVAGSCGFYFQEDVSDMRKFMKFALLFAFLAVAFHPAASAGTTKDTIVFATNADARAIDPQTMNDLFSWVVCKHVYQNLVTVDEDYNIIPDLAEKYEIVDPTTYRFTIKKGLTFHNGELITIEDVKFSFDRAMSPAGSATRNFFSTMIAADIVDDATIDLKLSQPTTPFLMNLTLPWACILNKKAVETLKDDYGMNPVGSGPFKFVSWKKGDRITLDRFDGYSGAKPKFKTLVIRTITESNIKTLELESGAVDIINNPALIDMQRLKADSNMAIYIDPRKHLMDGYLGFNCEKGVLKNPAVRQALAYAVDVAGIQKSLYRGTGEQPGSILPSGIKYADKSIPPQKLDMAKAKAMLKEAGVEPGLKMVLMTNDRTERKGIATVIQGRFKELGIDVEVQPLEWAALINAFKEKDGKYDMYVLGHYSPTPDPDGFLSASFHSSMYLKGGNLHCRLQDKEIDEMIDAAAKLPDGPEREKMYKDIQQRLNELKPWVPIITPDYMLVANKKLKGVSPNGLGCGLYNLSTLYYE